MALHSPRRRPAAVAVVLCLFLTVPVLAAGGAQAAAPAAATRASAGGGAGAERARPAAAPSSDVLQSLADLLARLLSGAPAGPAAAPAPDPLIARAAASTVRVSGVACGIRVTGSGFSAAPDTIVTNAHVVAGVTRPVVLRPDGVSLAAQVQTFDPSRDLAVLSVPGLGQAALPLASAVVGESDVILGHPGGQVRVEASPARVVRRVTADVGNIYDTAPSVRQILVLSAQIDPGDSGAPVVNSSGQVVGVAFAVSTSRRSTAFAVASEELAPVLARRRSGPVSTGPCLAAA